MLRCRKHFNTTNNKLSQFSQHPSALIVWSSGRASQAVWLPSRLHWEFGGFNLDCIMGTSSKDLTFEVSHAGTREIRTLVPKGLLCSSPRWAFPIMQQQGVYRFFACGGESIQFILVLVQRALRWDAEAAGASQLRWSGPRSSPTVYSVPVDLAWLITVTPGVLMPSVPLLCNTCSGAVVGDAGVLLEKPVFFQFKVIRGQSQKRMARWPKTNNGDGKLYWKSTAFSVVLREACVF